MPVVCRNAGAFGILVKRLEVHCQDRHLPHAGRDAQLQIGLHEVHYLRIQLRRLRRVHDDTPHAYSAERSAILQLVEALLRSCDGLTFIFIIFTIGI